MRQLLTVVTLGIVGLSSRDTLTSDDNNVKSKLMPSLTGKPFRVFWISVKLSVIIKQRKVDTLDIQFADKRLN